MIHTESSKIRHFLAIADVYIRENMPTIFEVEPYFDEKYRPDIYMRHPNPIVVEVQRTHTSNRKMQEKVDSFARTYREKKHDAKIMWIVTDENFRITIPEGFEIYRVPLKKGVST